MRTRLLVAAGAAVFAVACGQTDAGITTSVKSQLAADELVRARTIDVDTRDRTVTLTGQVRSTEEEAKALEIARTTEGVSNVVDQIDVMPEAAAPTTGIGTLTDPAADTRISAEVKSRLLADPDTSGLRVDVDTSDGVVTLTGTVRTQAEKTEALTIARQVNGVTNVTDQMTVEAGR